MSNQQNKKSPKLQSIEVLLGRSTQFCQSSRIQHLYVVQSLAARFNMNIDYIIIETENATHCLKETNCQQSMFGREEKEGEKPCNHFGLQSWVKYILYMFKNLKCSKRPL